MKRSLLTATWRVAAVVLLALSGGYASATHVDPLLVAGNTNCAAIGFPDSISFKPDGSPPPAGTYALPGGGEITITYVNTALGQTLDFTSTRLVDAAIMKGGPDSNVYIYFPDSVLSDTGLHPPINPSNGNYFGFSHWEFCINPDQPILIPNIDLLKEVSVDGGATWHDANDAASAPTAAVGGGALYRLTVTNTGDTDLVNVTINDATLGIVNFVLGFLGIGQTVVLDSGDIPQLADPDVCEAPGIVTNVADVVGESAVDGQQVFDSDPANVICADIAIDKEADRELSKVGDTVTYTFILSNLSPVEAPALDCTAVDSLIGPIFSGVLPLGDTVIVAPFVVPGGAPDPLLNTVTLDCTVVGSTTTLHAEDSDAVDLFQAAIAVAKAADRDFSKVGDTVNYSITLSNLSSADTPDLECTATDTLLGVIFTGVLPLGDTVADAFFAVPGGAPDPLVNTVTLDCTVAGFGNALSASASDTVELFQAAIDVAKAADRDISKAGDTVNYTFTLSNLSSADTPDLDCTASDSLLGPIFAGILPLGDTVINAPFVVPGGAPDPLVNTVTLDCTVLGFGNALSASASDSVDLIHPSVALAKVCQPDPVAIGETITWDITAENTGDAGLECLVNDSTAGVVDEPLSLGPGESGLITASREVLPEDAPVISNTASISCTLSGGVLPNVITAPDATADCAVLVEEICRTPGFWGTHAGTEKKNSSNLTQLVIDAAGGSLLVCGKTIDNTSVGNVMSAVEGVCVSPEGEPRLQLARQLIAMALNCVISGGGADCSGTGVDDLFADADAACAGGAADLGDFIGPVDCFNNGGQWIDDQSFCAFGTFSDGSFCSSPDQVEIIGGVPETCSAFASCHDRLLDESDVFAGVSPLPGPAGSSKACNAAIGNNVFILP